MASKNITVDPDALADEPITGKRLVLRFEKQDFELADLMHDRGWEEAADLIAALSGEMGMRQIKPALVAVLSEEQLALTEGWNFATIMKFSVAIGERLGNSLGTPGE